MFARDNRRIFSCMIGLFVEEEEFVSIDLRGNLSFCSITPNCLYNSIETCKMT
jgi:hypothetical protein